MKLDKIGLSYIWKSSKNDLRKSCSYLLIGESNMKLNILNCISTALLNPQYNIDECAIIKNIEHNREQALSNYICVFLILIAYELVVISC